MPKTGRPIVLEAEPEKIRLFLREVLRHGNEIDASVLAGIDPTTVQLYKRKAHEPGAAEVYVRFSRDLSRAHARVRKRVERFWLTGMRQDWRAAKEWLACKYPAQYARTSPLFLVGKAMELALESGWPGWLDAAEAVLVGQGPQRLPRPVFDSAPAETKDEDELAADDREMRRLAEIAMRGIRAENGYLDRFRALMEGATDGGNSEPKIRA